MLPMSTEPKTSHTFHLVDFAGRVLWCSPMTYCNARTARSEARFAHAYYVFLHNARPRVRFLKLSRGAR